MASRLLTGMLLLCELGSLVLKCQVPFGVAASTQSLSDLTLSILVDNDLYGNASQKTSRAILVESMHSRNDANGACNLLGERLWSPTTNGPFNAGLNNSLSYQAFLKYSSNQLFWIDSLACTAIDTKGKPQIVDCHKRLPVLCTNSAPLANRNAIDNTAPWHVTRKLGQADQVVTGYRDQITFRFLGIRFAPNPERFAHSTVQTYNGPKDISAVDYPPICLQNFNSLGTLSGQEDCLFLNIWTPYLPGKAANTNNLKPVVVWIHGGGFIQGNANDAPTDGGSLASRGDVVFVAIQYRLGNFGWLGINSQQKSDGEGNGNYGLGDMITALKWIKQNIKSFGGDPSKVTIMGISAGGISVRALLASKKTKGLISGAIISSGPGALKPGKSPSELFTLAQSLDYSGESIIEGLGCGELSSQATLDCMRDANSEEIGLSAAWTGPVIDKVLLNGNLGVTGKGDAVSVPLIIGVLRDDWAPFNVALYGTENPKDYLSILGSILIGEDLSGFLNSSAFPPLLNPTSPAEAAFNVSTRIMTDWTFTCLNWATAYSLEKHGVMPATYVYNLNRTYQPLEWQPVPCMPPVTPSKPLGDLDGEYYKCHGGDTYYVFGTGAYCNVPDRDGLDIPFTQYIIDQWSSFVRTGDPNPDVAFLKARGYVGTLDRIAKTGRWEKLDRKKNSYTVRTLQWNSHQKPFTEQEQCAALGLPLDYYKK